MDVTGGRRSLPAFLTAIGILLAPGAVVFAGRIVYESTILTWQRGLQMVGFSMLHGSVGIAGLLSLWIGLLWVVILTLVAALSRTLMTRSQVLLSAILVLSFGLVCVPYGYWKLLTVKVCGIERVTPYWLTAAAARGETPLLRHLIASGFDINTRNEDGESLLTISKRTKQARVSEWLMANGAQE